MTYQPSDGWGSRPNPRSSGQLRLQTTSLPQRQPAQTQPRRSLQQQPLPSRGSGCGRVLFTGLLLLALAILFFGSGLVAYASIARDLPLPDELQARVSQFASTLIYDRQGELLNEVGDPNYGRRTAVPLEQISPHLRDATIATEDPNFYRHPGVDPAGVARAFYYALKDRDFTSGPGGSTITQQLVKLAFLSPERTLSRKLKETILAAEITRRYSKDTILQIYLNEIYYGNLAYGIEAAAETYFDKRAADLTLAEAALLAGLPQAPTYYDPYTRLWDADGRPGLVKRRQGTVLRLMVEHGYITPSEADIAWQEPITLKPLRQTYTSRYPHFVQYARGEVEQVVGPQLMAKGGLRIYTTLDQRIQVIAQDEVTKGLKELTGQGATNSAVVAVRPGTGEVLAMVGSADFSNEAISGQVNMALSPRQPGSAIKPFTYLAAFEMPAAASTEPAKAAEPATLQDEDNQISAIEPPGYWTPATALMDVRTEFPDGANPPYVPVNFDNKEHGLVSLRSALANSYNIPAVKALEHAGLEHLKEVAHRVGITTLTRPDYGLSLTLGGGEVTLLELTGAYGVLANGGARVPLSPVACVLDGEGKLIWAGNGAQAVQACAATVAGLGTAPVVTPASPANVLNPQHVYLMTSILSDLEARRPMFGATAALLSLPDQPAAVKTGTTNDYRDAWTVGYTPDLAVGVWVGNADYKPMKKIAGSRGAAPIWHNVMARTLQGQPVRPFVEPPGIQHIRVCADSGTLPGEACSKQREELFATGQGPLPASYDLHQRVRVDRVTGQLATEYTPADRVEEQDVMIFPPKYRAWAEAQGYPLLARERPEYAFSPELILYSPQDGSSVTDMVAVLGRARVPEPLQWRLEYGVGPDPIGWGVLVGPNIDEVDGRLATWDVQATEAQHGASDYSLRLAAYDSANMDYPVAVSNITHVIVEAPAPIPTPPATEPSTPMEMPTLALAWTPSPVPTETAAATPAETPQATPTAELTPTPATATPTTVTLQAVILEPAEHARVSGLVQVAGVADGSGFAAYQLEYAAGDEPGQSAWHQIGPPVFAPSSGGLLGIWPTDLLRRGIYSLRLKVYDQRGTSVTTHVVVEVVAGN